MINTMEMPVISEKLTVGVAKRTEGQSSARGPQLSGKRLETSSSRKTAAQSKTKDATIRNKSKATKKPQSVTTKFPAIPSSVSSSSPTKIQVLKSRQANFAANRASGSFLMNTSIQKAPFSNSNKQVHVNLIRVDKFDNTEPTSLSKAGAGGKAAQLLEIRKLKEDVPDKALLSARTTISHSSHSQGRKDGGAASHRSRDYSWDSFDSDDSASSRNSHMLLRTARARTSAVGVKAKEVFQNEQVNQNDHVQQILARSAAIFKKAQSTITKANTVTKRAGDLIGSTLQVEEQLARMSDLLSQNADPIVADCEEQKSQN